MKDLAKQFKRVHDAYADLYDELDEYTDLTYEYLEDGILDDDARKPLANLRRKILDAGDPIFAILLTYKKAGFKI